MGASVFFESVSELARLSNTFTVDGTPTDPTTITLTVTDPTGASVDYTHPATVTRDGAGIYHKDVTCSAAGEWTYKWVGTGAATDTTVGTFTVQEATLGRLYATPAALKSRLGIPAVDTADDYELHLACFAASRAIEHHTGRLFWRTAAGTARTFAADSRGCLRLPRFCDLLTVSELATDDGSGAFATVWAPTDYQLLTAGGANASAFPEPRPYDEIAAHARSFPVVCAGSSRRDRVRVTGVWGWPSVPMSIRQAALILAQETFKAKDTFGGVAGFGEFGVVRLRDNPLLATYVDPYTRMDAYA
jgi:hypothetical protein